MKEIKLSGRIDENVKFPKFNGPIPGELHIDLSRIEGINSVGCREWITWIQNVHADGGIFLHNCPPHFIAQMSILFGGFPDRLVVKSLFVPYYCDSCGAEELKLIECGPNIRSESDLDIPDQIICPICSAAMRLDVIKKKFFAFLSLNAA